ncbi:DUF6086 family protein [Streptomyces sp. ISL-11]|uniref:DUF6086 family protein n=1 Tax=Streptomyces sp. ISL-11 TaxID=2819174 RepID=UPI001BE516BD|nr:DUF6086 family protein [Streptomyces sp. ISL-11]MBT2387499.1 hypothetical protein [Streptomyces sp. ISL-11]
MSQYFQVGDRVLWSPANRVAELFYSQAEALVPAAGVPHGIGPKHNDEYDIDPVAFAAFVQRLVERYEHHGHLVLRTLIHGFVATALVLAEWGLSDTPTDHLALIPRTEWLAI